MKIKKNEPQKNCGWKKSIKSIGNFCQTILSVLVSICAILILMVMPFYFQEGYTHIGTDKSYFFRTGIMGMAKLILPVLAVWLACVLTEFLIHREKGTLKSRAADMRRRLVSTDIFCFLYFIAVIISYFCSDYKQTARWGTRGWFMGMFPQLALVAVYFLLSRFQLREKWMFWLCLPVSAVTFVLGYLNRFDIWPLSMPNSGRPLYISTIGNINWYCGYITAVFFLGVGLLWLDKGTKQLYTVLLSIYVFTGFAALLTNGSDSGLFALAVVLFVLFILSVRDEDILKIRRFWLIILLFAGAGLATMGLRFMFPGRINYTTRLGDLLTYSPLPVIMLGIGALGLWLAKPDDKSITIARHVMKAMRVAARILCVAVPAGMLVFVLMIAVNTVRPGSLGPLSDKSIFTFNNAWGSHRGATWSIGLRCFGEQNPLHKLVGVGPDCMSDFLYTDASPALLETVRKAFEGRRLTNAHCELLTLLVNVGIWGGLAFAGILFSVLKRFLSAREHNAYAAACGLCVLAYFANNLWSFQQSMSVATIFAVMGLGERFLRRERDSDSER